MISLEYSKDIDSYYSLPFPSVGATTNLILYSCIGTSEVIIENCAIEPEILNLVEFLNKCGAKVHFDILKRSVFIKGVSSLNGTKIEVISDRIQIMTYVALAMMHRRRLHLYGVHSLNDIAVPLAHLGKSGLEYSYNETRGTLSIFADKIIKFSGFNIKCGPYPEFPTDLQPIFLALSLMAESTSLIEDTVIPNRNVYITELTKLGYDVSATKHMLKCNPSDLQYISNQQLVCPDLRGGMACIMAASVLKGKTTILNGEQVLRGYDNLRKNLSHFMDISFAVSENTSTYNNAVAV
jgi:UDP-N-acetylglucosamine 1-carboxyvinyltransferase